MEEIFRGHLDECFQHFSQMFLKHFPKSARNRHLPVAQMADFCGVTRLTVLGWIGGRNTPKGQALIKLLCWLDLHGYKIIELERTKNQALRGFVEILGFNLITPEQAIELLGYKHTFCLYDVFRGKFNLSEEKSQKMWEVWKMHRSELTTRRAQIFESSTLRSVLTQTSLIAMQKPNPKQQAILHLVDALNSLLEENSLRNLSEEDHSKIDKLLGHLKNTRPSV